MLKYITEKEYGKLLVAESIPDNFDTLVIEASTYINSKTHNRIDVNDIHANVKYATALIVTKKVKKKKLEI